MKIGTLRQTNPALDCAEVMEHRALYGGGKMVRSMVDQFLYQGANEAPTRYAARKARAYYVNHCAALVDQMIAWLFSAQPHLHSEPTERDPFWESFLGNVDRQGLSLHQYQAARFREAFVTGRAWTLLELPQAGQAQSLADEDKSGQRRAYVVPLATEAVIDWQRDEAGALLWAIVHEEVASRLSPTASRGLPTQRWTIWEPSGWQRFEWTPTKPGQVAKDDDEAQLSAEGAHSFGVTPLVELELPAGFYVLSKIRDQLVEGFNARCAKSWAMYVNLYATAVHKKVQSVVSELDGSSTNIRSARTGAGYGIEIGADEDLFYLEQSGAAFAVATEHIAELKDELYRVVHQMALSADNSAGAMGRSGESKATDNEASEIVLQALSEIEAPNRQAILSMAAAGRGESIDWDVVPVHKFSLQSAAEVLQESIAAGSAGVRSPTFEKERQKRVVSAFLPDLQEETAKQIDDEIEMATDMDPQGSIAEGAGGAGPSEAEGGPAGDKGEDTGPNTKGQALARVNGYTGPWLARDTASPRIDG